MLNVANTGQSSFSSSGQAAFLRRLTEDDQFRTELQADPQKSLAEYGMHVESHQLPKVVTLPEVESFSSAAENESDAAALKQWFGLFGD